MYAVSFSVLRPRRLDGERGSPFFHGRRNERGPYFSVVAVKNAIVSVTPVINTDNGKRFYIIDTGAPGGCLVVSYSGGKFKTAFDASSVPGDWTSASIEVQKKDLILHLSDAAGTTQDHVLVYDKKAGTFTAEDSAVSTTVIQ